MKRVHEEIDGLDDQLRRLRLCGGNESGSQVIVIIRPPAPAPAPAPTPAPTPAPEGTVLGQMRNELEEGTHSFFAGSVWWNGYWYWWSPWRRNWMWWYYASRRWWPDWENRRRWTGGFHDHGHLHIMYSTRPPEEEGGSVLLPEAAEDAAEDVAVPDDGEI